MLFEDTQNTFVNDFNDRYLTELMLSVAKNNSIRNNNTGKLMLSK